MSLTNVKMSEEVWLTCITHALSTETEEIMGLLLGDIEYSKNDITALIWGASPQSRSDRRKDRVETNPEQLAAASAQAERMTALTGQTTRVIGWYHSHPHITVIPSHVDVRTQAMYQLLDPGFIGLIFSCFSEDPNKVGRIQVIAFQSSDGSHLSLCNTSYSHGNRSSAIDVESSSSGNASSIFGSTRTESSIHDTADSRSEEYKSTTPLVTGDISGNSDSFIVPGDNTGSSLHIDHAVAVDIDPMDVSESMQEAIHRSSLEVSGAAYVRKEIPLQVLPASLMLKLESPLASYTDLQHVLFEEERGAYDQAILQNLRDGSIHPLAYIHHTATYEASLCKMMEYCLNPAITSLQDRVKENEIRLAMLADEAKILDKEIADSSARSSQHQPRNPTTMVPRSQITADCTGIK